MVQICSNWSRIHWVPQPMWDEWWHFTSLITSRWASLGCFSEWWRPQRGVFQCSIGWKMAQTQRSCTLPCLKYHHRSCGNHCFLPRTPPTQPPLRGSVFPEKCLPLTQEVGFGERHKSFCCFYSGLLKQSLFYQWFENGETPLTVSPRGKLHILCDPTSWLLPFLW